MIIKEKSWKKGTTIEKKEKHNNLDDYEKGQLIKYKKKGKKVICDNLDDDKRTSKEKKKPGNLDDNEHLKKETKKRIKEKWDNLYDNKKEQLRKYKKKVMCDSLDEEKDNLKEEDNKRKKYDDLYDNEKEQLKKEDSKRKKEKYDNLGNNEKEQLIKCKKKGKCDNPGDGEKVWKNIKRKMDKYLKGLNDRNSIFNNVQMCSMTHPSILTTPDFRLSNWATINFSNYAIYLYCWKNESCPEGTYVEMLKE